MSLSCDTKKFYDNESTHMLHNFWTSTQRGEASPFPPPLAAPLLSETRSQARSRCAIGSGPCLNSTRRSQRTLSETRVCGRSDRRSGRARVVEFSYDTTQRAPSCRVWRKVWLGIAPVTRALAVTGNFLAMCVRRSATLKLKIIIPNVRRHFFRFENLCPFVVLNWIFTNGSRDSFRLNACIPTPVLLYFSLTSFPVNLLLLLDVYDVMFILRTYVLFAVFWRLFDFNEFSCVLFISYTWCSLHSSWNVVMHSRFLCTNSVMDALLCTRLIGSTNSLEL